eukprot:7377445-Prymnesium_polylepis.1
MKPSAVRRVAPLVRSTPVDATPTVSAAPVLPKPTVFFAANVAERASGSGVTATTAAEPRRCAQRIASTVASEPRRMACTASTAARLERRRPLAAFELRRR